MKIKTLFAAVLTGLLMASCGSDESSDPPKTEYSDKELSLHGGLEKFWLLSNEKIGGTDVTGTYKPCQLDDTYSFDVNDRYAISAGDTYCQDNPEPETIPGYFKFDEANSTLELSTADTVITVNILELSASTLKWKTTTDDGEWERTYTKY